MLDANGDRDGIQQEDEGHLLQEPSSSTPSSALL